MKSLIQVSPIDPPGVDNAPAPIIISTHLGRVLTIPAPEGDGSRSGITALSYI